MAVYGVTGVHVDSHGRIERVAMQRINPAANEWVGRPNELAASEVANLIAVGNEIYSIFIVAGENTVHGPKFKRIVYEHGDEGIELSENVEGRKVQDLIQF